MNNPLNRTMFRQAGMSKQPMGILASSPELMTTAQKAMMNNQPVRAEEGVYNKLKATDFVNIKEKIADQNSALNQNKNFMKNSASPITSIGNSIANVFKGKTEAEIAESQKIKDSQLPPIKANSINEYITKAFERQKIIDKKNEELNPNYKAPFKESETIDKNGNVTVETGKTITADGKIIATDGTETKDGTELIEPPKKRPIDLDTTFQEDLTGINNINEIVEKRKNDANNFNLLNKIDKTIKNDNITNSEKANKIDKTLGIEGLKNKIKARELILDEIMGSAGSDVRTDANYVMMMTGLLIASGQDPNALSNIAQGAAKGLSMYGEAQGKDLAEKRKVKLVAAKLGFQAQASEDAKKSAAAAATLKFSRDYILTTVKEGLGRDKAIVGLAGKLFSNQNLPYMPGYIQAVKENKVDDYIVGLATNVFDKITGNKGEKSTEINSNATVKISENNEISLPSGFIVKNGHIIEEKNKNKIKGFTGIKIQDFKNNYISTGKLPDFNSLFAG